MTTDNASSLGHLTPEQLTELQTKLAGIARDAVAGAMNAVATPDGTIPEGTDNVPAPETPPIMTGDAEGCLWRASPENTWITPMQWVGVEVSRSPNTRLVSVLITRGVPPGYDLGEFTQYVREAHERGADIVDALHRRNGAIQESDLSNTVTALARHGALAERQRVLTMIRAYEVILRVQGNSCAADALIAVAQQVEALP